MRSRRLRLISNRSLIFKFIKPAASEALAGRNREKAMFNSQERGAASAWVRRIHIDASDAGSRKLGGFFMV